MPVNVEIKTRRGTAAEWASANPVLSDGEPGLETDTGIIKYGDDVSHWDELPAANKQFQNIVTVAKSGKQGTANFICSRYNYDDECIQAAIDYCSAHSIKELWINEGYYTINAQLTGSADINIKGIGNVTLFSNSLTNDLMSLSGSVLKTVTGSDVVSGSTSITVSDATDIIPGYLALVYDNTIWGDGTDYPNWKTGELHEVLSVSGSVINFVDGLLHSYTASNGLFVIIINPIKVNIENIIFLGASSTISKGHISLVYTKNSTITNCELYKGGLRSIEFLNSYMCKVKECKISDCLDSNLGYGIVANDASAHILIYNNKIDNCRHCFASGGYQAKGQPRNLNVFSNELFGSTISHVVDAHPGTESIHVYNNTIHCNGRYAFSSGAAFSVFSSNLVYDGFGASIRGSTKNINYTVNSNEFYRCGYAFDTYVTTCTQQHVTVKNNKMYSSLYYIAKINNCNTIEISGNSIDKTTIEYGLYLLNISHGIVNNNIIQNPNRSAARLYNCTNLDVTNNTFENSDTAGLDGLSYEAAISLENCTNINILKNTITDVNTKQRYAIREYGTSNNNIIKYNNVTGSTVAQISTLGANTKVSQNDGYPTENTGTATIPTSSTSIAVTHNLASTPTRVTVTPTSSTEGIAYYVPEELKTATTFTITMLSAPTANVSFDWSAVV